MDHVDHAQQIDVQGHRGCRGLLPENSLSGFLHALELGVNTLEMDVVISADSQVVVSHEPFMSHLICLDSAGSPIASHQEREHNIFKMTYPEILKFDCGSLGNPNYKEQRAEPTFKPLLSEVIQAVEARATVLKIAAPYYNIETKSQPEGDHVFHPPPAEFVALVLHEITKASIKDRVILQSFDPRTLQATREQAPEITLALLVENELSPDQNLQRLGFTPEIYSPYYQLVDEHSLQILNQKGMKVIPWTINETDDMQEYLDMGVQGIITDYPDRLLNLLGRLPKAP